MQTQIDHLVVAATSLDQGVQWCEALFGITPALGGEHALFGTHNRLFNAERQTNKGILHWQISVRADGQRLFDGALPTLIQWGKTDATEPLRLHPRNTLPRSGVTLQSINITHPSAEKLQAAYASIGLNGISISEGLASIKATLKTPKGIVVLE